MLKAEDKDATIEFLRSRIAEIKNKLGEVNGVWKYMCCDPDAEDDDAAWDETPNDVELYGIDEILDLCDMTLAETTF